MPELPEVETVRRGLERLVVGKTIEQVRVRYAKMIGTGVDSFVHDLPGQTIERIGRRGKYLLFYLTGVVLVSHLRMEGKYLFYSDAVPERKHAHVFFEMTDGGTLVYEDVRKFGTMELLRKDQLEAYFAARKLGPEPTEAVFLLPPFVAALSRSKKPIKPYLLEQTLVVGLGNIYVDEALWRARIHPARPADSLKSAGRCSPGCGWPPAGGWSDQKGRVASPFSPAAPQTGPRRRCPGTGRRPPAPLSCWPSGPRPG